MELLIKQGASLDAKDSQGKTPLHLAVAKKARDGMIWLIKNGATIDAKDEQGRTILHLAAKGLSTQTVKELLDNEAAREALLLSENIKNNDAKTPLQLAMRDRFFTPTSMIDPTPEDQITIDKMIHVARGVLNHAEYQDSLLSHETDSFIPLAVKGKNVELLKILIKNDTLRNLFLSDRNQFRDKGNLVARYGRVGKGKWTEGDTLLYTAINNNDAETIRELLRWDDVRHQFFNADNLKDKYNDSPLEGLEDFSLVEALLEHDDVRNTLLDLTDHETVKGLLEMAVKAGNDGIAQLLLSYSQKQEHSK